MQVLMTYWDMNRYEVEDLMTDLLKKSLAQSEFDVILDSYVYRCEVFTGVIYVEPCLTGDRGVMFLSNRFQHSRPSTRFSQESAEGR